ncbi:MAG: hypothetical protein ACJ8AW_31405 [Rhodopila sp.]
MTVRRLLKTLPRGEWTVIATRERNPPRHAVVWKSVHPDPLFDDFLARHLQRNGLVTMATRFQDDRIELVVRPAVKQAAKASAAS